MAIAYITDRDPEFSIHASDGENVGFFRQANGRGGYETCWIRVGKSTIFIRPHHAQLIMSQIAEAFGLTVERKADEATIAEGDELNANAVPVSEVP